MIKEALVTDVTWANTAWAWRDCLKELTHTMWGRTISGVRKALSIDGSTSSLAGRESRLMSGCLGGSHQSLTLARYL